MEWIEEMATPVLTEGFFVMKLAKLSFRYKAPLGMFWQIALIMLSLYWYLNSTTA